MPNPFLNQNKNQNQTTAPQQTTTPAPQTVSPSAYQQNLQKPVQQPQTEITTSRQMYGQIGQIARQDQNYGQKLLDNFHLEQQNPASIFYNAYGTSTNKAVQNLASYGIDASQINEAWYQANPEWQSYLVFNGTTNTPSKPGKKATIQQKIAYEIYQLGKADNDTQNMKSEWAALQDELTYWARRSDLNMSDDEIIDKVNAEMKSKYPTLYRMQESLKPGGALLELNERSDFSTDGMYGTIWAARNGGGTGNMESDIMLSAMGEGSVWKDNESTRAKLDRKNKDTYSPYEVGMTLNDAGLYFGYSGFNDEVLEKIRQGLDWNDQTAVRYYNEAVNANETTKQAEKELTDLYAQVDKWINKSNRDEKWILDKLDSYMEDGEYKTLKAMDDSIRTGGKVVDTTRAVAYRRQIIDDYIHKKVTERDSKLNGGETANKVKGSKPVQTPAEEKPQETPAQEEPKQTPTPTPEAKQEPSASEAPKMTEADIAQGKETDKKIRNAGDVLDGITTDGEKTVWANAGSSFFDGTKLVFQDAKDKTQTLLIGMAQNSEKAVTEHFFNATMDNIYGVARYEAEQDALAEDRKQFAELQAKYGDVADYRQEFKPSMTSTVQYGNEDVNVSLRWNDAKGKYIVADITAPGLGIYGMDDDRFAYVYDKNSEGYALTQLAEKAADDASVTASKANAAQERLDAASETEKAEIERYKRLDGSIRKREDELNKGEKEYLQQKEDMDAAWKNLGIINSALQDLGMDTVNIEQIQLMSEYLSQFFDEPALPRSEETYYQWAANVAAYSEGGATTANVSATLHTLMDGVNDEIDKLNMALEFVDQNGYKLPDNVYRNMQYGMQDLENKKKGIEYSLMMTDVDEGEKKKAIEAGKAFEEKYGDEMNQFDLLLDEGDEVDKYRTMYKGRFSGSDYMIYNEKGEDGSISTNYFELITPEEEDLYYYLLGQKVLERGDDLDKLMSMKYWTPEDTALVKDTLDDIFGQSNDFLDYMDNDDYGVWTSRNAEYTKLHAQGMVDSGWAGGALMNIAGTVATPAESLVNALYLLDRKVNDKRINSDSKFRTISMAKEATRSATFQSIKDTYGDGTWQEKLASFGYEIYCNRGDSLMNSLAFGGLFKFGGKFGNMINSFLGATPMGATAALNAAAEAVENGANTDQAWLIAGMTFFSETLTEAITLGNIKEAFSTVEELSDDTLKGIIKDWLLDNGVEEAFGESINDIAENAAARWAASMKHSNYQDEFGQMVEKFMGETGCSREEAEEMALEEQARGVLHTAIVSYLSAGSEAVIATGKAALNTTNYYKSYTKSRQKIGYGESTLDNMLHDWRVSKGIVTEETKTETAPKAQTKAEADFSKQSEQEDKAYARQARAEQAQQEVQTETAEQAPVAEVTSVTETETAEAEPVAQEAKEEEPKVYRGGVAGDILLIEEAKNSDASTKSAALATALELDVIKEKRMKYGYQDYTADAAGAFATDVFGKNADSTIQEILSGANEFHLNTNSIKMAIQNAILGNGAATALVQTDEFKNASPVQKARMMARTLQEDMYNEEVRANAQAKITEFRKTRVVTQLAGQGHFDNAVAARAAANKAKQTSVRMNQNLETQRNVEQAAAEATAKAGEAVAAEPTRENVNALNHAVTEQENQSKVTQEYEQAKEKADNDHKAAEEKAVQAANDAMNEARAIADQQIAQEDQQQAEAEAQRAAAEEQAAQEQAEAERQQLLEDQRSGKLEEDSYEEKIRRLAEERGLKGEQAEKFVKDVLQFAKDKRMGNVDMTKQMSETEANLMMGALSRRFNINVRIGDTDNNANGQYDPSTNTITLNKNLTAGQVLLEFSLHELTHSLESTKSYGKYHDTALNILYASEAEKKQAVADKMAEYEAAGHPITAEQAERELVADFTRTRLNDKNVVARMVDAGLGGRMRNALHNINQFLKNITGRMSEEERLQAEQLRRAERAFQKAINERTKAQKASNQAGETELSIGGAMTEAQKAQAIKEASQDYNDALARMDYKAAQEDVDFAAEEAGYVPEAAYHGTSDFGFTEFDTNIAKEEGTIFVAFNPTAAYTYSRAGVRTVSSARPQTMSNEELIASALEVSENTNSGVTNIQFNNGKFDFTFDDGTTESLTREEVVDSIQQYTDYGEQVALGNTETKQGDFFDFSGMTEEENLAMRTKVNNERGTYKLYTRPGNQLVVDAQGRNWDDIPVQWSDKSVETNDIARYAKENGYDSVRINNVIDHGGRALNEMEAGRTDVGIFFNANDVKSADIVTRDDNGNVIPLSERFNTANNDIRYSVGGEMTDADKAAAIRQIDSDYMTAAQNGDTETAQRIIDEAAKEAGYTEKVYHGTPTGGFTVFDVSKVANGKSFGEGIYFTDSKEVARNFERVTGRTSGEINQMTYEGYLNLGDNPLEIDIDALVAENGNKPSLIQYLVDSEVKQKGGDASSIVIRNIQDGSDTKSTVYVAKDSNQFKSADPITYDDDGNIIPPSERFNLNNPDIRYSVGGEMTTADMDQALIDAGILTKDQLKKMNKTDKGEGTRQWGTHMAQDMDELAEQAREYVLRHSAYEQDTNKEQIERAVEWFKKRTERLKKQYTERGETVENTALVNEAYASALQQITDKKFNFRSADGQARMAVMMGMAIARGDIYGQVQIANQVNRQGTALGQALQSRKLFRLMTPEGRIATLAKMLDDQQQELYAKGKDVELKFSDWLIRAAGAAENEGDMALVRQAAINELADQLPANFADRIRSLRMLSMLANPRTHIRNIIGNAMFVPFVSLKNKIGAFGEIITGQERTKTLKLASSKEVRTFAREQAKAIKDVLTGEAKYTEATQLKKAQSQLGKFMDGLSNLNSIALEGEDWFFLKGHFRRAFGGWMTANGYTVEQVQSNPELLQKGQQYAIDEAQKATYRDFNEAANKLNALSRDSETIWGKGLGFVTDAVLPFKKTPANILRRGLEYSPLGIAKGLTSDMVQLHRYNKAMELYEQGKITEMPKHVKSPNQVIDDIASGLSGTAVMALGWLLAGTGAVTCDMGDDEDKFEKLKGAQKYSINPNKVLEAIGVPKLFGEDVTYTMDWAAPMAMPLFVGAAIRENTNDLDFDKVFNAITSISEPIFNLSMLDGLNSIFKTSQYDDTNQLTQIGAKILSNYMTSFVPSVAGAATRSFFDDTSRKAFVKSGEGTGVAGTFRYAWEQTENKLPGVSKTNIPNRDIWGRPKSDDLWERIVENFISPGYIEHYKDDPVINEMQRLYTVTGDSSMIPKEDPEKKYTRTKNKVKEEFIFTAEEWDKYKEVRGQTALSLLTELINSDEYNNSTTTDAMKVKMIDNAWQIATDAGRKAVIPDYDMQAIGKNTIKKIAASSEVSVGVDDMLKYLDKEDYASFNTMVEYLRQHDMEDADIKGKIRDRYRDAYKAAYKAGEEGKEELDRITNIFDSIEFNMNDLIKKWEKAVDNAEDEEEE